MTHATGIVTADGAAVRVGAAVLPLPKAQTPVGQAIAAMIAAIDAGELQPCIHCGKFAGCDCDEWVELMTAPPPSAPLDVMTEYDLPY